jgi:alpha-beta hydrolase superfamily lysophospholipase
VRQGHVQTLLARRRPPNSVTLLTEQPMLIGAGVDETGYAPEQPVRLLGYYNPAIRPTSGRGLIQIIHGWHGCSHSSDVLYISDTLLKAGYSVFRLNLRDHGPNQHVDKHALNKGMFLATLLKEVAVATRSIALLAGDRPFALVGGSLGGNYVLRLGDEHNRTPIPNLKRIVAICPAVQPDSAAYAIDSIAPYRMYFRARWMQGLRA